MKNISRVALTAVPEANNESQTRDFNDISDTFKTLGSNAVPMAFTEVYSALETRTVDGQENPFNNIENMKFYEVQKYLTLTKHAYSPTLVLFSKKVWDNYRYSPFATDPSKATVLVIGEQFKWNVI